MMTGSKKSVQISTELIVNVEHVKFRQSGPGKSPLGVMSIYHDRVEWTENGKGDATLVIPYSSVQVQRISPPNKDKVQLQIKMHNDDQATFVFMRPGVNKEALVSDRDTAKETIQQALIRYRQIVQSDTAKVAKTHNDALEAKKKFLLENKELQNLYRYLVSSKLISPEDFWSVHSSSSDKLGIPSDFLSSLFQRNVGAGVQMNLTTEVINAIFTMYPVVEKKHLELVPHAMTEQEFWEKFIQSHYFHRERDMNEDPNDPFFDCDKQDAKEMGEERSNTKFHPTLDFGYLLEDLGVFSDFIGGPQSSDSDIDRLMKRCNYQSSRLLSTLTELEGNVTIHPQFGAISSTSNQHVGYEVNLESDELSGADSRRNTDDLNVQLKRRSLLSGPKEYSQSDAIRWKNQVLAAVGEPICSISHLHAFFEEMNPAVVTAEMPPVFEDFCSTLRSQALNDLKALYPVTRELLRHFWLCTNSQSPEAVTKLHKMYETLIKFEDTLRRGVKDKFGSKHSRTEKNESEYERLWDDLYSEALKLPNISHPKSAVGSEENAVVVETFGGPKIEEKNNVTAENLVKSWKCLGFPVESLGSRGYYLQGSLASLETALLSYAFDTVKRRKPNIQFEKVSDILPLLTAEACGLPTVEDNQHHLQYLLADDPQQCLSGTAELGIGHLLRNTIFNKTDLPKWFISQSRCFRPEISQSAAEAKLYRVHEFYKLEMFVVSAAEESDRVLDEIVDIQKEIFADLGFHCRLLDMPTEELGAPAARKFDIEAWMPGRKKFGEISSASNCTDFQSRRLGIQIRSEDGLSYAHTLNGTALASTRSLITLLETFQNAQFRGDADTLNRELDKLAEVVNSQNERIQKLSSKYNVIRANRLNFEQKSPHDFLATQWDKPIAVLIFVCNRAAALKAQLGKLLRYRPSKARFPIVVSQDCDKSDVENVARSFSVDVDFIKHLSSESAGLKVPPLQKRYKAYYQIARHYKLGLDYVFNARGFDSVIILEDDLDMSSDIFEYFGGTRWLLDKDPTLFCVSAWNDNGKPGSVDLRAHEKLYRSDFFPGLGWMMTKKLWDELGPRWPEGFWDDWIRDPAQRNGRQCIRPEISRTAMTDFGKKGASKGLFFNLYLKKIFLNDVAVNFTQMDTRSFLKENYDGPFIAHVYSRRLLTLDDLLDSQTKGSEYRLEYSSMSQFTDIAKKLKLMADTKAGVPRTAYMGIVSCFFRGNRIYLAPSDHKNWGGYDVKWEAPMDVLSPINKEDYDTDK